MAAGAQFQAGLELQQGEALHVRQRLEKLAGPALDLLRRFARMPAPVHHCPVGLVLKEATQAVVPE
jgi:hypothetical protein